MLFPVLLPMKKMTISVFMSKKSTYAPNTTPTGDMSNPWMVNIDIVDLLSNNFNEPKVFINVSIEAKNY